MKCDQCMYFSCEIQDFVPLFISYICKYTQNVMNVHVLAGELTRAIRSSEVNGLFFDLVKLLLGTLFQLQVDEEDEDDGGDNCNMTIKGTQ